MIIFHSQWHVQQSPSATATCKQSRPK